MSIVPVVCLYLRSVLGSIVSNNARGQVAKQGRRAARHENEKDVTGDVDGDGVGLASFWGRTTGGWMDGWSSPSVHTPPKKICLGLILSASLLDAVVGDGLGDRHVLADMCPGYRQEIYNPSGS